MIHSHTLDLQPVTLRAGPMKDVPIEIKVFNNNVISIWFDPTKVNSHFGQTPDLTAQLSTRKIWEATDRCRTKET